MNMIVCKIIFFRLLFLLLLKFVKKVIFRLGFTLFFKNRPKANLKFFQYQISSSVKRFKNQLPSKVSFSTFLHLIALI